MNTIITIGREYGSGGREIGQKLGELLNIPVYDKNLLVEAAKESGLCEGLFENLDEKPNNSFLYSLVMDTYSMGYSTSAFTDMPINYKIFLAQFDTIKSIAEKGPCIFIGRCADYALAEFDNVLNIFVRADIEYKIKRIAEKNDISLDKARDSSKKTDKKRANYYNYYSNKKWGDAKSYNMTIDSSKIDIDGSVELIKDFIRLYEVNKNK